MAADPNLFQQYLKPVRSVAEYGADMDARESNQIALMGQKRQNELAGLQMEQTRAGIAESAATRNELQRAMASWTAATTPAERAASLRNSRSPELWKQADAIEAGQVGAQKAQAEVDNLRGKTSKDAADTEAKKAETKYKAAEHLAQGLPFVRSPADIVAYIDRMVQMGVIPPEARQQAMEKANSYPSVDAWKADAEKASVPALERFKAQADAARAKLASDTQIKTTGMNNATSRANNASSNAVTMRGQDLVSARAGDGAAEIREQRRTDKKASEDDKAIQKFSATLSKEGIPDLETAISGAEGALARYKKGGVPGIGPVKNMLPAAMMSEEGKDVRQALASVRNIVLSARSGAAVTDQELRRLVEEIGSGGGMNEDDARKGLAKIRARIEAIKTNASAGVSDDVQTAYRDRGGLDIKRGAGKAPSARIAPPAANGWSVVEEK